MQAPRLEAAAATRTIHSQAQLRWKQFDRTTVIGGLEQDSLRSEFEKKVSEILKDVSWAGAPLGLWASQAQT